MFYVRPIFFLKVWSLDKKTVLVVGVAGYIGSHVNKDLIDAGYQSIILDNLSRGTLDAVYRATFIKGDYGDADLLDRIFTTYPVDAVLHFAALKDLGESIREPLKYYSNNVASTLVLLDALLRHNVKIFVFSSSAAILVSRKAIMLKRTIPIIPLTLMVIQS